MCVWCVCVYTYIYMGEFNISIYVGICFVLDCDNNVY